MLRSDISFGFECEGWITDTDGRFVLSVPARYPRDAMGDLTEIRSLWYPDPGATLASFVTKREELSKLLKRDKLTLVIRDEVPESYSRTAGFHIHFSRPDGKQMDIPKMMATLARRFEGTMRPLGIPPEAYRMKPYGWEWRRLPASVDPELVARVLREEFC